MIECENRSPEQEGITTSGSRPRVPASYARTAALNKKGLRLLGRAALPRAAMREPQP